MPELIVLRGLPGSGKTTWARAYVGAHRGHAGIVSRDVVRRHVLGLTLRPGDAVLDRAGEDLVTSLVEAVAGVLLAAGCDVVADATHLSARHVEAWRRLADRHGATVRVVSLDVPVAECIRRDAARAATGGRSVGADVITRMAATSGPTYEEAPDA